MALLREPPPQMWMPWTHRDAPSTHVPRSYKREYLTCCIVRMTRWSAGQSPPPQCGLGAHHRRWTAIIVPLLPG
eukprot:586837-Prymnesium_polylepis.1